MRTSECTHSVAPTSWFGVVSLVLFLLAVLIFSIIGFGLFGKTLAGDFTVTILVGEETTISTHVANTFVMSFGMAVFLSFLYVLLFLQDEHDKSQ